VQALVPLAVKVAGRPQFMQSVLSHEDSIRTTHETDYSYGTKYDIQEENNFV
jgi:hypothetical protein